MKRLFALLLAVLMVVSMVACSKDEKKDSPTNKDTLASVPASTPVPTLETDPVPQPTVDTNSALEAFIEENGEELCNLMTESMVNEGLPGTSEVKANGNTLELYFNFDDIANPTEAEKAELQEMLDVFGDSMNPMLPTLQQEIPGLECFSMIYCDKNGNVLGRIDIDGEGQSELPSGSTMTVEEFVELGSDELLTEMEASFATSSGMTCTSSIEAVGNAILIYININELDNLTDADKKTMQDAFNDETIQASMKPAVDMIRVGAPDLEYLTIYVCEKDGDKIAEITVK